MRVIIVPDEGEWVLVPKVATDAMHAATLNAKLGPVSAPLEHAYAAMIAAAPPTKVVELPRPRLYSPSTALIDRGWNDCLDEIERRAKG